MARQRKRRDADPKKAVGYIRVSTDVQALSPEAQMEALKAWCKAHEVALVAVCEDISFSGGLPLEKRPGLLQALDTLTEEGVGILLVAKRDRLARDVIVGAMVERLAEREGARVMAADGTWNGTGPEAELMRRIVDGCRSFRPTVTLPRIALFRCRGSGGFVPIHAGDGSPSTPRSLRSTAEIADAVPLLRPARSSGHP